MLPLPRGVYFASENTSSLPIQANIQKGENPGTVYASGGVLSVGVEYEPKTDLMPKPLNVRQKSTRHK